MYNGVLKMTRWCTGFFAAAVVHALVRAPTCTSTSMHTPCTGTSANALVQNTMYYILGCLEPLTVDQDTAHMSSKRVIERARAKVLAEGVLQQYDTSGMVVW